MKKQHPWELLANVEPCEADGNDKPTCLTGNIGIFQISKNKQIYQTYGQINGQNVRLYFQKNQDDFKFKLFKHEHTNIIANLEEKVCNI